MHYTSIENIHKVIDPLFLDEVKKELESIKETKPIVKSEGKETVKQKEYKAKLRAYQDKLASLKFLDKRQAYLIQANGKEKSPKSLDIKGFGDCLVLGDFLLNGHFRRKRPITARQILTTGANEKAIV